MSKKIKQILTREFTVKVTQTLKQVFTVIVNCDTEEEIKDLIFKTERRGDKDVELATRISFYDPSSKKMVTHMALPSDHDAIELEVVSVLDIDRAYMAEQNAMNKQQKEIERRRSLTLKEKRVEVGGNSDKDIADGFQAALIKAELAIEKAKVEKAKETAKVKG